MKKNFSILATAALALGMFSSIASATPINNGSGLASPAATITFNEIALANNTVMSNQYASLGISSVSGLFYNGCENNCVTTPPSGTHPELSNFSNTNTGAYTSLSDIIFGADQSAVAFEFASNGGLFTLTALLAGNIVESFQFQGGAWGIYGFTGTTLDEIRIQSPSAFLLDNLQLSNTSTVPEPGSLALLGLGLFGLGALRRRKTA